MNDDLFPGCLVATVDKHMLFSPALLRRPFSFFSGLELFWVLRTFFRTRYEKISTPTVIPASPPLLLLTSRLIDRHRLIPTPPPTLRFGGAFAFYPVSTRAILRTFFLVYQRRIVGITHQHHCPPLLRFWSPRFRTREWPTPLGVFLGESILLGFVHAFPPLCSARVEGRPES